jgi:hypothetical protein
MLGLQACITMSALQGYFTPKIQLMQFTKTPE